MLDWSSYRARSDHSRSAWFSSVAPSPPLLHTEPLIRRPRPTDDVDGVIDAENYVAQGALQHELRAAGFTEAIGAGKLAHRWR